ncbi:hypothetical protein SMRU11_01790 (plasmid) [Sinorhizobium meliloti RU11/001]|nr:hypothetical protein SMRU11_01790 [Sinorhizobium meliloti RU11/001]
MKPVLIEEASYCSKCPVSCVRGRPDGEFGEPGWVILGHKIDSLERDHGIARGTEFCAVSFCFEGSTHDTPFGLLAKARMLEKRDESKKGSDEALQVGIVGFDALFKRAV